MAFFIPSSIQKRLLRYALSRVELLDTDALDLDSLEIALGRRSTIELKDVALRQTKLASVLHLPPKLVLESAKVKRLHLVVPANLHASSIIINLDCIEVAVKTVLDVPFTKSATPKKRHSSYTHATTESSKDARPESSAQASKRNTGFKEVNADSEDDKILPTPSELAQSFLAEEPENGKEELEAALASQSVDLQQSVLSSEDGDAELSAGLGVELALPSFLAAFFKGIGDRMQVNVANVLIKLDSELDLNAPDSIHTNKAPILSPTTCYLHVDVLDVQGIQNWSSTHPGTPSSQNGRKVDRRRIVMRGITLSVSAEPFALTHLSQIIEEDLGIKHIVPESKPQAIDEVHPDSPSSDLLISSQLLPGVPATEDEDTPTPSASRLLGFKGTLRDSFDSQMSSQASERPTVETAPYSPRELLRRSGGDEVTAWHQETGIGSSAFITDSMQLPNDESGYFDSHGPSDYLSTRLNPLDVDDAVSNIEESVSRNQPIAILDEPVHHPLDSLFDEQDRDTSPEMEIPGRFRRDSSVDGDKKQEMWHQPTGVRGSDTVADVQDDSVAEDMSESKFYSHEEAESIYASALYGSISEKPNSSVNDPEPISMPGVWTASKEDSDLINLEESVRDIPRPTIEPEGESSKMQTSPSPSSSIPSSPSSQSDEQIQYDQDALTGESENVTHPALSSKSELADAQRSSVRLGKEILAIDEIEIVLSSIQTDTHGFTTGDHLDQLEKNNSPEDSTNIQMPGTFSLYAQSTASLRRPNSPKKTPKMTPDIAQATTGPEPQLKDGPIEINIGTVKACADVPAIRLLIQLQKMMQDVLDTVPSEKPSASGQSEKEPAFESCDTALNLNVREIEFRFAEHANDIPILSPLDQSLSESAKTTNVLFIVRVNDCVFSTKSLQRLSHASLDIGKFSLSFSDEDILSFSKEIRIRTSLRDLREEMKHDISIKYSQIDGISDILISTKPLHVHLDVQKLDRTLGSIGGLSGLLELGNSITSEATITNASQRTQQRTRTVRFESPIQTPKEPQTPIQHRVNARIGGTWVTLKGESCSLQYRSSAVKIVARPVHVSIQVDDMKLSGPYNDNLYMDTAVNLRLRDTRFVFLHSPEETDLTRLISLLTPSKDKFEGDDDLLLDTLLRQRRKGSVLRVNASICDVDLKELESLTDLQAFVAELSKLSAVTKYLPEESRPGLMMLGIIREAHIKARMNDRFGPMSLTLKGSDFAHISGPLLVAAAVKHISCDFDETQPIITDVIHQENAHQPPMLMLRMLGDDIQPTVKLKLWNVCVEYSVSLAISLSELANFNSRKESEDVDTAITGPDLRQPQPPTRSSTNSFNSSSNSNNDKPSLYLDITFRDCALGLTPFHLPSKAVFVLTDTNVAGALPGKDGMDLKLMIRKGSVLLVDNREKLSQGETESVHGRSGGSIRNIDAVMDLCNKGFVSMSYISAAEARIKTYKVKEDEVDVLDIDFRDELFLLESCADSTQTLIETLSALSPPRPPSTGQKYRTEIAPLEDMMASFTGEAVTIGRHESSSFSGVEARELHADDSLFYNENEEGISEGTQNPDIGYQPNEIEEDMEDYNSSRILAPDDGDDPNNFGSQTMLKVEEHITGAVKLEKMAPQNYGLANKWDSARNRYVPMSMAELSTCPLKVKVHDLHIIWNLYDGYDWERTRETITKAVQDVEAKAMHRRDKFQAAHNEDGDDESVIGDFLFNSIYIGVPVKSDPHELSQRINNNIDDLTSEATSHVSSTTSKSSHSRRPRSHGHKLRLDRSKRHKIAFELKGVSADIFTLQPGGETQSSFDIRVQDLEIFDHVPTSTWKKFATYMHDAGSREERKPMVHIEICDVRPVPELTATELVIRVSVLPLRLHIDQDALDFITRFFDFKDDSQPAKDAASDQPYLQRVEVRPVRVRLDYKPKKIDYAGLRSGRATEFMNFFILDGADMVLKHAIVYGTSGFDKLHRSLEAVWMPDIRKNQLPGVLAGLNGVRTLVNVGSGVRDLLVVPIQEYQKDGRIVRSISKGALAFAKTTGSELSRFGAKLAVGAQTALQGAEEYLVKSSGREGDDADVSWDDAELDAEEKRAISHYANQPAGILQGLKGAARSLERDLLVTKDIIIAISGEVRESGNTEGAARAVVRNAPTLVLRPMIGASKAISQTLMGVANTVDPQNKRRMEDKYKRY